MSIFAAQSSGRWSTRTVASNGFAMVNSPFPTPSADSDCMVSKSIRVTNGFRFAVGALATLCTNLPRKLIARRKAFLRSSSNSDLQGKKSISRWLGGGLEEIIAEFNCVVVFGRGCVHDQWTAYPWALDCLLELRSTGAVVIIAEHFANSADEAQLLNLGLLKGHHFDSVFHIKTPEEAKQMMSEFEGAVLVVGESGLQAELAKEAGASFAVVCTGSSSLEFGLSPAPLIDVPANGGRFVEPDGWQSVLEHEPDYGLACFSFSESFFFRHFAARRAMVRAAFMKKQREDS